MTSSAYGHTLGQRLFATFNAGEEDRFVGSDAGPHAVEIIVGGIDGFDRVTGVVGAGGYRQQVVG